MRCIGTVFLLIILLLGAVCRAQENASTERIKKPVAESIRIRQDTQEQEQRFRDDKEKLHAHYDQLEQTVQQLTTQRQALDETVDGARTRIGAKQKQLADIELIQKEIAPLIDNLIKELEHFVAHDLPFLAEERRGRLQRLRELRDDPAVAVSEKFRKVMEALLVEAEYGNTIEVYQEIIAAGNGNMLVDIFRLGRVGLFFQTLDHTASGFYNVATSAWQPLPAAYNRTIQAAIEIGAKRRSAELLTLPLGRIQR